MIYYYIFFLGCITSWVQADQKHILINENSSQKDLSKQIPAMQAEQKTTIHNDVNVNELPITKIIEHLVEGPSDRVLDIFSQLSLQTKKMVLKQMSIEQYEWFLFAFSEEQWSQMRQRLSKVEKEFLPATKVAQLVAIRDTWAACASGDILRHAAGKCSDRVVDLPVWRNLALKRASGLKLETLKTPVHIGTRKARFRQWLQNQFIAKKLRLLKELR
jgi:hypothetical protein